MRTLLVVNVCVIVGYALHAEIAAAGLTLPLFVPCLLVGIAVGNLLPARRSADAAVSRTAALALVSDYALGVFLAISLMSLKLWALVDTRAAAAGACSRYRPCSPSPWSCSCSSRCWAGTTGRRCSAPASAASPSAPPPPPSPT